VPRTLDCGDELALVLGARAGNPLRDDLSLFGDEALQLLLFFIFNLYFLLFS